MSEKRARKIIQISSFPFLGEEYEGTFTTVLCNDHTVWELDIPINKWTKLPDIPQD